MKYIVYIVLILINIFLIIFLDGYAKSYASWLSTIGVIIVFIIAIRINRNKYKP